MRPLIAHRILNRTLGVLLLLCVPARAEYALIPSYQQLVTWVGFDIFRSSENFAADNVLESIQYQGAVAELSDFDFNFGVEYGIANGWSAALDFQIKSSELTSLSSGNPILGNAGLSDIYASLKWALQDASPYLALETRVKFPVASNTVSSNDEIVLGDGNFDLGLILHTGAKSGRFYFFLSPGFLLRFGGYSMATTVDTAIEFHLPRGYVRGYGFFIYSFEDPVLFDSNLDTHDAQGSGGSYARLTGGPVGMFGGGQIGIKITEAVELQVFGEMALFGSKYPNFLRAGGNVAVTFDFYEEPKKTRVKEVPFDMDYNKFDRQGG